MRALFVGLGSIGARHLKNLAGVCQKQGIPLEVTALRSSGRELGALVEKQVQRLPQDESYDVAFITNPTNLHAEAIEGLKGRVGTFFIEKPIFESLHHSLDALGLAGTQKAYVAAPMRWCGVYLALQKALQGLPVYSVRAICSSYLPGWRAGVDYRNVYSAKREMGGGVALDLIHEWDYLVDLFGYPQRSFSLQRQVSNLEISSDDLAVYIAAYKSFLCELHLDYFGRVYRRDVELFTPEGTMKADFGTGLLTLPDGAVCDYGEDANRRYEREMEYFVQYACHEQGESMNSPQKAMQVLKLALGEN